MTQCMELCINFSDPRWNLCPGYDVVNSNKKWQGSCFWVTFSKWFWKPLTCLAYANEPSGTLQWLPVECRCWELSEICVLVTNDLYQMKGPSFRQSSGQDGWCPLTWMWFLKLILCFFSPFPSRQEPLTQRRWIQTSHPAWLLRILALQVLITWSERETVKRQTQTASKGKWLWWNSLLEFVYVNHTTCLPCVDRCLWEKSKDACMCLHASSVLRKQTDAGTSPLALSSNWTKINKNDSTENQIILWLKG